MKELFLIKIYLLILVFSQSLIYAQETNEKEIYYDVFINISKCKSYSTEKIGEPWKLDNDRYKTTYRLGISAKKKIGNLYIGSGIQYQERGHYTDTAAVYSYIYPSKYKYYYKISYTYLVIPVILQYNIFQKQTGLTVELAFQPKLEFKNKLVEFQFGNNSYSKNKESDLDFFDSQHPQFDISTSLIYCYNLKDNNSIGIKATYTQFLFAVINERAYPYRTLGLGINYSF